MVHLESRNIDQENKRIEIGCKGRFACAKPFCFTSFLSNYLILGKTDSFFLNLRVLLEEELLQCWKKDSWDSRDKKILSHSYHLFFSVRESCGRGDGTPLGDLVLVLAVWSLASHFSFLTFSVLWSHLMQQPLIGATVRIFSEPTILWGVMDP